MALQYGTTLRNAQLDVIETTVGTTPILEIRSGAPPANCGTADSGTLLASMTLPSDWMAAASGGSKAKSGTLGGRLCQCCRHGWPLATEGLRRYGLPRPGNGDRDWRRGGPDPRQYLDCLRASGNHQHVYHHGRKRLGAL